VSEKRHVIGGVDGWLNVKREPTEQVIALPEYLLVEFDHAKDSRDFFAVLEGAERGMRSQ
jgi:hypothetical protein